MKKMMMTMMIITIMIEKKTPRCSNSKKIHGTKTDADSYPFFPLYLYSYVHVVIKSFFCFVLFCFNLLTEKIDGEVNSVSCVKSGQVLVTLSDSLIIFMHPKNFFLVRHMAQSSHKITRAV
jgi:hypothetical protein